ncbi:MAG: S8 family serine peptidase [Bacteroidota bacterium]
MKRFITHVTILLGVLFVFSLSLPAQTGPDYRIILNSGEFVPEANTGYLSKSAVLRNTAMGSSLYNGKYYVTIQFNQLPDNAAKATMKAAGIELIDYIPNFAFTAAIDEHISPDILRSFNIRSIFQFTPVQKTNWEVLNKQIPPYAIPAPGYADVTVITYEKLSAGKIMGTLNSLEALILEDMPVFRAFTIRVPQQKMDELVALPFIQWTEFIQGPRQTENLPGRTLHRVNVISDGPRNLKGDGVNVGIWDAGEISPHLDFSPSGRVTQVEFSAPADHSTHCAGTILGRGLINPFARGMAPNAPLFSWNFSGNIQNEMAAGIPAHNLVVSSHSYNDGGAVTCNINGTQIQYTLVSRNTDLNLNNFPTHLHVHSSGNAGGTCAGQYMTITGTGKSAKNNVVVGNITSTEGLSGSSSCGPVQDGRIKPELVSMGTSVFSTYLPLNSYATISGTSMSTPGVAGSLALLVQRYKQLNGNTVPPSTLVKNAACNAAHDLGNPGPDYRFGFGRINALNAVRILENNRYLLGPPLATGGINNTDITVPAGTARLKVLLTWNDPAAAANANPALVNNLDLTVINGATTTLPWILDKNNPGSNATQAVDNISNMEQVTINNPPAGTYTLRVTGTSIPSGPQDFALTWIVDQPYIEVIYPNGPESFSPGSSEVITWDNSGVTGNQTVEYSTDNGGSWTVISSSVPAATTRLTWTIPAANTSTALVRVTSGALSDASDVTFKILGTVSGFGGSGATCSAGEVIFTWSPTTDATHYDIYSLNPATGDFVLLAGNITGTSFTATGLTPGVSMWFTIRAKNNTTGSLSERANAINVTVSTGGGGIGAVGPITGPSSICGTPSAVPYSITPVSGATSYNWTAPPGASIASGQGTISVTVNYPAGSSNGNLSVTASNGTCSTAPSTLAITINAVPNAPTSGGNQSQTICLPNPIPTLTATATVPSGHIVIWYNAATGGSLVASPTLNTAGTVTYYAASRNTTSGCESTARTAVTLTITTVAQASVSAGGATTFCQGGSVVLTANSGTSYNWSNGATTQSITVSTSGSYTVAVTTSSCTSTSPPVNVTVNALPAATITAGGPLSFCQGGNVTLTASAGSSWLWSTGATTQSITVNSSGNYSVTVTNASGCSASSAATSVNVSPNPTVSISASPYSSLFPGLSTTLTANVAPPGSYNYTWYKDNVVIPGATAATLTGVDAYELGSYTVTVTNSTGLPCSNTSAALVIRDSATTKLFILPNPNRGKFDVIYHSNGTSSFTLGIYDSKGAFVYQKSYSINSPYQRMEVDIKHLGKGLYHVVIIGNGGKRLAEGKVVVQ